MYRISLTLESCYNVILFRMASVVKILSVFTKTLELSENGRWCSWDSEVEPVRWPSWVKTPAFTPEDLSLVSHIVEEENRLPQVVFWLPQVSWWTVPWTMGRNQPFASYVLFVIAMGKESRTALRRVTVMYPVCHWQTPIYFPSLWLTCSRHFIKMESYCMVFCHSMYPFSD